MDRGESYVSMEICERGINFKWEIVVVYGLANHRCSAAFLEELHSKISSATLPVVVGDDFNLIHYVEDKSNSRVNFPRMQLFNECIADLGLRELDRVGVRFTWTNRQADPTMSVLDRVFMDPEWELKCPLASFRAITRIGSHHVPLLLSSENYRPPPPPRFRFEAFWLNQAGFADARSVLRGDANTAYFQAIVNNRRCRNSTLLLWDGETLLERPAEIHVHMDDFFKALFSPSTRGGMSLAQSFWNIHQRVSDLENAALTGPFSEDELWAAIKGMNPTSPPVMDGLPVKFFQTLWDVI
ncbi:hypothetical protein D1007_30040 [Hordeum vulgare]|nr:hypothetical protein D1007_30040 [Hordeum vulgare]